MRVAAPLVALAALALRATGFSLRLRGPDGKNRTGCLKPGELGARLLAAELEARQAQALGAAEARLLKERSDVDLRLRSLAEQKLALERRQAELDQLAAQLKEQEDTHEKTKYSVEGWNLWKVEQQR